MKLQQFLRLMRRNARKRFYTEFLPMLNPQQQLSACIWREALMMNTLPGDYLDTCDKLLREWAEYVDRLRGRNYAKEHLTAWHNAAMECH